MTGPNSPTIALYLLKNRNQEGLKQYFQWTPDSRYLVESTKGDHSVRVAK